MEYELRHNDDTVLLFDITENFGISKIKKIVNKEKVPIGIMKDNSLNIADFSAWLDSRGIPAKREGIPYILEKESVQNVRELLFKNNGLGLTDHYWISEAGSDLQWKDINYFENDSGFGTLGEDIYLGTHESRVFNGKKPHSSASGMLPKKWVIKNDIRYLLKGSETAFRQEPFNEKIASQFIDCSLIEHVDYQLVNYKNNILSVCPNMLDNYHELISAYFASNNKKDRNESYYNHYIRSCKELGIKGDIKTSLDQMIVIDYLIGNTDRHWSNFGVIRNSDTLQVERLAPLYDHGASFFPKTHHLDIIGENTNLKCQSFKKTQAENLKLVKDFSWLNKDSLKILPDIVKTELNKNKYGSEKRTEIIIKSIRNRIDSFRRYMGIEIKNIHSRKI